MSEPSGKKGYQEGYQKSSQEGYQKSSQKILSLLINNPQITIRELSQLLTISGTAIKKHLFNLKKDGKLRRVGPKKGGHWEVVEE